VEKVGRDWVKQNSEVKEVKELRRVKEIEEVRERAGVGCMEEEICWFGEDNMKECIMELARE
jgi:hypothetical protein